MILRRWTHGRGRAHKTVSLIISDYEDADVEITDLYVHPSQRGRGWARWLVDQAIDHCLARNYRVVVRVRAHGKKGLTQKELEAFYRRVGFVTAPGATADAWMVLRR